MEISAEGLTGIGSDQNWFHEKHAREPSRWRGMRCKGFVLRRVRDAFLVFVIGILASCGLLAPAQRQATIDGAAIGAVAGTYFAASAVFAQGAGGGPGALPWMVVGPTLGALAGAATAQTEASAEPGADYATPYDPLSPLKEKLLAFNVFFEDHVGRPVAGAWSWVLPYRVRLHIQNFFRNTGEPRKAINCLLQRKFHDAGVSVGRFSVNTTLGVIGLFDVADDWFGLKRDPTDFGLTAAHDAVDFGFYLIALDFGPYLMAPVVDPTSLRDAIGSAANGPMNALSTIGWLVPTVIALPVGVSLGLIDGINERSLSLDTFEAVSRALWNLRVAAAVGIPTQPPPWRQSPIE